MAKDRKVEFYGEVEKYKKRFITLPDVGESLNGLLGSIREAQIKKIEKIKIQDTDTATALDSFQKQVIAILRK